jgi:hypothetical protein
MKFIDKLFSKLNEEALNYRAVPPGTKLFKKVSIEDDGVQKVLDFYSKTTGQDKDTVQANMEQEIQKTNEYLSKSPKMNDAAIEKAPMSQAYYLIDGLNLDTVNYDELGIKRADLVDIDIFFDLTDRVIVENSSFFPLRNPYEPRSLKPFFFLTPDDLYLMTDPVLKANASGEYTAFATPDAKFCFCRSFFEKLALFAIIYDIKPTGKKYISNGGKFPDWYCYLEFVILHELLHFVHGDHFYTKSQVQRITKLHPEIGSSLAHKILNYVGDFVSNHLLVKSGFEELPIGLFSDEINYDRLPSYESMVDTVIEEFKKLNPEDQEKTSNEMSKQQDDHVDNSDQKPSQGGQDGEPSKQDSKHQEGEPGEGEPGEGEPGEGEPGEGEPGEGEPGEGEPGEGKPGDGKPGDGKSGDGKPGAKSQSEKIEDAMRKAQEKMANKDDNSTERVQDVLNKTGEYDNVDDISQAKKTAKEAHTLLDTTPQEDNIIDWRKLLKKMIPTESFETEDTYSKMSRSTTSSMVTVAQTGTGRIQPGEILTDPDKKSLLFVIDNSGSVMSEVSKFNNDIIKLLEKNKSNLDNFFVMKFSDDFDLYKVDVKAGTFQQIQHSEYDKLFDQKGKKLAKKIKVAGETKKVKTDLFKYTFGGGTYWKPAFQFMIESFFNCGTNIVLFTDDDLATSDKEYFKKFYKLGNKKRGQVAMFITDESSFKKMKDTFGTYKWVTVFK